jgi:hypothetical protein
LEKTKINFYYDAFKILFFLVGFSHHAQVGNAYYKKQLSSSSDSITNNYTKQALKSLKNRQYKLAFNSTEAIYNEDYLEVGDENSKEIVDKVNESIKNAKNVTGILKM